MLQQSVLKNNYFYTQYNKSSPQKRGGDFLLYRLENKMVHFHYHNYSIILIYDNHPKWSDNNGFWSKHRLDFITCDWLLDL